MVFFRSLFGNGKTEEGDGEEVAAIFVDEVLGRMEWSDDHEAWVGRHAGLRFSLSLESGIEPTHEIIEYARSIMGDK
jgi:hypothetical protein